MEDECPICLEPLTGTIVHLDCCKNKIHIQCYVNKCPFCRAELPSPHVIVPIPVAVPVRPQQPDWKQKLLPSMMTSVGLTTFLTIILFFQYRK